MLYDANALRRFAADVFQKTGLSSDDARLFADSLIEAELRGVGSHGLTRLKAYARRIEQGLIDAKALPQVVQSAPSLLLIDACNAAGVCAAYRAMQLCINRAAETGACFAAVFGGNHFGIGAYFSSLAAKSGMIGFAATNAPAQMAPTGGRKARLGTNPIAISIPAGARRPFCLDMATSVVARGKVTLAEKEGNPIPEGWGIDAGGNPTTDPAAVACMLPFGGAKGYGIALAVEMLCSCLAGAATGTAMGSLYDFSGKLQNVGFFLGAINISSILPREEFGSRMDSLIDSVKACPRAAGSEEIFIPGEIEDRRAADARKAGIAIPDAVLAELRELSAQYRIPFSCEAN